MAGTSRIAAALAVASLIGFVSSATAGPIAVFTQISQAGAPNTDEIRFGGLGTFGVLTTGGGVNPVVTVAADQTSAHQAVVGFWPVLGFSDLAQYDAQRGTIVTIPDTTVRLYSEVWNSAYGQQIYDVQRLYFDATVSARVGTEAGQTVIDWNFANATQQAHFGDTTVTISYQPVRSLEDGIPSIFFNDGSPGIGSRYYPTLLEATIDVSRAPSNPDDGGNPGGPPANAPEPASALLLSGLTLGGLFARRRTRGSYAVAS